MHRGSVLEFRISRYPADHPAAGRLATVVNADGKQQHLAYTTRGEQRAVWGDSVQPLLYDYNEYGERVGMRTFQTTPDGDPSHVEDTGAKTAWHFHEATGSLLRKEYADGKGPEYAYTEAGQLAERRWARESSPQRPQRGTEAEGNPAVAGTGTAGVPPASQAGAAASRIITAYTYDPATLQLANSIATDGTAVQYEYDPDGRLAKVTDATGTREFAYDLRGQVTKETVLLQHDPAAAPIHYEIRRTYTKLGQPESVHLVSPDGQSVALDHRINYAWNDHSQLAIVKSLAGDFAYGYDANSPALLTKMTGPVHSVETSYEPHRNLITGVVNRVLTQSAARRTDEATKGKVVSSYTYSNDLLGRRETISQGGEAFGMLALGHNQVEVAYNDRSEVTGAVYRTGGEARQTFDYAYDAIGNRRTARSAGGQSAVGGGQSAVGGGQSAVGGGQSAETRYETNALNRGGEAGRPSPASPSIAVPHDLDGNLLEDARNTYTWNADNNLIRVDAKDGSLRLDYIYDHQSRRTVRVETSNRGKENESRRTTYYVYDDWNLVAEYSRGTGGWIDEAPASHEGSKSQAGDGDQHSAVTGHGAGVTGEEADAVRYYTWGRDLSGSLQGAGGVGGLLAISKVNLDEDKPGEAQLETSNLKLETIFPTYDANGNIGQLVDTAGTVIAAYAYDPFGNVTEMAGAEAAENPWRFSTKPVEAGTGWLYYGYRCYDAEMGRWVNRDPIEESGGETFSALSLIHQEIGLIILVLQLAFLSITTISMNAHSLCIGGMVLRQQNFRIGGKTSGRKP